jgi:hypothetical protein
MGKLYLEVLESLKNQTMCRLKSFQEKTIDYLLNSEHSANLPSSQLEKYFELLLKLKSLYLRSIGFERPDAQLK